MDEVVLNATVRKASGKGVAHKLRAQGLLPGVFYLGNKINTPIQLDAHELHLLLKRKPSIITLKLDDGSDHECVVRHLQRDPVSGKNLHIDLMGIVRGVKMTVEVNIELVGSSIGVRDQGGVLQQAVQQITVECLPKDIPDRVTLDITELSIGDSLHVSDIVTENFRILDDPEKTIVSILAPRVEKEVTVAEEAEEGEEVEGEEGAEEETGSEEQND